MFSATNGVRYPLCETIRIEESDSVELVIRKENYPMQLLLFRISTKDEKQFSLAQIIPKGLVTTRNKLQEHCHVSFHINWSKFETLHYKKLSEKTPVLFILN